MSDEFKVWLFITLGGAIGGAVVALWLDVHRYGLRPNS